MSRDKRAAVSHGLWFLGRGGREWELRSEADIRRALAMVLGAYPERHFHRSICTIH